MDNESRKKFDKERKKKLDKKRRKEIDKERRKEIVKVTDGMRLICGNKEQMDCHTGISNLNLHSS